MQLRVVDVDSPHLVCSVYMLSCSWNQEGVHALLVFVFVQAYFSGNPRFIINSEIAQINL